MSVLKSASEGIQEHVAALGSGPLGPERKYLEQFRIQSSGHL